MTVAVSIQGFDQLARLEGALRDYQHRLTQESVRLDIQFRAEVEKISGAPYLRPEDGKDAERIAATTRATIADANRRAIGCPRFIIPPGLIHVEVTP